MTKKEKLIVGAVIIIFLGFLIIPMFEKPEITRIMTNVSPVQVLGESELVLKMFKGDARKKFPFVHIAPIGDEDTKVHTDNYRTAHPEDKVYAGIIPSNGNNITKYIIVFSENKQLDAKFFSVGKRAKT